MPTVKAKRLPELSDEYARTVIHRIMKNTVSTANPNECWIATSHLANGYAKAYVLGIGQTAAHRVLYQLLVRRIPDHYDLDHLCRRTACVNPYHMEPVPPLVNVLRGASPWRWRRREWCGKNLHRMVPENVYRAPSAGGERRCRACVRAYGREFNRRRRARERLLRALAATGKGA